MLLPVLLLGTASGSVAQRSAGPPPPPRVVWAWHGAQHLRTIDPTTTGVAFLERTLTLTPAGVRVERRRSELLVPPGTWLLPVVRIERDPAETASAALRRLPEIASLVRAPLALPGAAGVQIDFDSPVSYRPFYRALLARLRSGWPAGKHLSITALASWCTGDRWLADLPVDEIVPMLFAMGRGGREIWRVLDAQGRFPEPRCRSAVGISLAEPSRSVPPAARTYVFPVGPWGPRSLDILRRRLLSGAAGSLRGP